MQADDRHREVLLRGRVGGHCLRHRAACSPASQPDREHREPEQRDDEQQGEGDPCERVRVGDDVDDPQNEARRCEQEVTHDQRRADAIAGFGLLLHAAAREPDRQQHEATAGRENPGDQGSPLHLQPPSVAGFARRFYRQKNCN